MLGDHVLTVLAFFAAYTQILFIREQWKHTQCVELSTLLHFAGWFVLSYKFAGFMIEKGDLPISPPSVIALMCIAMAEVTATTLEQRKKFNE